MTRLSKIWKRMRGDMALGTFLSCAVTGGGLGAVAHGIKDMGEAAATFSAARERQQLYCDPYVWDPRCTTENLRELRAVRENALLRREFGRKTANIALGLTFAGTLAGGRAALYRRKKVPKTP